MIPHIAPAIMVWRVLTTASSPRRRSTVAAFALLLGALFASPAAPAAAHDELVSSDPAPDEVLAETPEEITLTFSNVPMTGDDSVLVEVLDESCASVASGDPVVDGTAVTQALSGTIEGAVIVRWRVVSSDGHPISDEFAFSVGERGAADAAELCVEDAAEQTDGSTDGFNALPTFIGVGILVVAVGAVIAFVTSRKGGRRAQ